MGRPAARLVARWLPDGHASNHVTIQPISDFRIPGIILLSVIGTGSLVAALLVLFNSTIGKRAAQLAGSALVIWIVVQMIMLRSVVVLQAVFLLIGITITWLFNRLQKD